MLLWIVIALLTAAAIMAVLVPLGRAASAHPAGHARRVYLDQLTELQRDREQGRIDAAEAEAARVEIARRLLSTEGAPSETLIAQGSRAARRFIALAALVGIPVLALGLYVALGAPTIPGQPLAARLAAPSEPNDLAGLLAQVEAHLAKAPEDGRGWEVIGPVYLRLGRTAEAATAYRNAIRILGSSAARQTGLGEAIMTNAGGVVTAEAKAAFEAANEADPAAPVARFFLSLAAEQDGDRDKAAEGWRALLADAPAGAPWRGSVEQALARVEPGRSPGGPTSEQVAAAQESPPAEQAAMIESMVSGLAQRLEDEPDDIDGWLRLIRSYAVLGRQAEARQAAENALRGVRQTAGRRRVEALLADLGLAQRTMPP